MARSATRLRSRLLFLVLGMLAALFIVAVTPQMAFAEEGDTGTPNLLIHIVKSAGWVFGPLLLIVSIGLVALIVLLVLDLRMGNAVPPGFVEDFTDTVNKSQFKQAYEMAREDPSFLGRVMTAGMARLQYGLEDAREGALNMVDNIKAGKESLITYLATIGTLGPMLGLVGTVWGMIMSFMVLSRPGAEVKIEELTKGISHALVITLLGIALSVPAIFCHAFFKNRLRRISLDTTSIADDLLTQMYYNSRKAKGAPPVGQGSAAAQQAAGSGGLVGLSPAELIAADAAATAAARSSKAK